MINLLNLVGARPQFIKVAPILRAIEEFNRNDEREAVEEVLVHTGQHYDKEMSDVFFDQLEIKEPEYNLGVGSDSHADQTGEMLKRIEDVLQQEKPDVVMVYGDTNSTIAGALAATKLQIPVAHVEVGLRSHNRRMPEEINRILTDHVSDILFCPTEAAVENLRHEGFTNILNKGKLITSEDEIPLEAYLEKTSTDDHKPQATNHEPVVINVGDVMYDAALQNIELAKEKSDILEKHDLVDKEYALVTVHRAGNTDDPKKLRSIFTALDRIAREKMKVILPIHPRTEERLEEFDIEPGAITIIDPVPYLDMINLEDNAEVIITDSGGVQKEAYFYEVPCVTLREETEWVETVEAGWNKLVGVKGDSILNAVKGKNALNSREEDRSLYGTGCAAITCLSTLLSL